MKDKICQIHEHGRGPGQGIPYKDNCPVCRERRGGLPPSERDIPPSAEFRDRKASHGLFGYGKRGAPATRERLVKAMGR